MWRWIEITNYRSIEKVSVYLAPFSVVVGPNGSGKSNFADTLVFARDVATDAAAAVERRGGITGVRRWRPTKPTDVTVDIRAASSQEALSTDYVRHQFTIHSGKEGAWSFRREIVERVAGGGEDFFQITRTPTKLDILPAGVLPGIRRPVLSGTASAMVFARQFLPMSSRSAALRNVRRIRLNPDGMRLPQPVTEATRLEESGSNIAVAYRSLRMDAEEQVLAAMRKIVPGLVSIRVQPFDRFLLLKFEQRQGEGSRRRSPRPRCPRARSARSASSSRRTR